MFGRDPFDSLFERMFKEFFTTPIAGTTMIQSSTGIQISGKGFMPISIIEGDKHIKVIAWLPGVNKEDIVLNAIGDTLEIRAKRSPLMITESERIIYSEIPEEEEVYRTIKLPAVVKEEDASAKFENGVLSVILPKAETSIKKGINIE
ncbi:Hsp20/alpha crystallin family protein [Methanocaldococcus fervens]|uniref:Heat shock protein Hsp20 n=1 Tax=Methanocaldococcus fervens (strain DSM 4213 / JCM 15782 / AG86) TaxID=573064 RepID=C7P7Z4_METFA|nr:Hsp20/alpha crystallin family protein [Methanocaldococcus fervens]ACV24676.1 heat shock protein Hsp20 [Methanocaldococcus fervens AG86]